MESMLNIALYGLFAITVAIIIVGSVYERKNFKKAMIKLAESYEAWASPPNFVPLQSDILHHYKTSPEYAEFVIDAERNRLTFVLDQLEEHNGLFGLHSIWWSSEIKAFVLKIFSDNKALSNRFIIGKTKTGQIYSVMEFITMGSNLPDRYTYYQADGGKPLGELLHIFGSRFSSDKIPFVSDGSVNAFMNIRRELQVIKEITFNNANGVLPIEVMKRLNPQLDAAKLEMMYKAMKNLRKETGHHAR